jgi:hypothetical protein
MYTTLDLETQVKLIKEAGITVAINDLKNNQSKIVPTSWFESLITGNMMKYLKIQIGNLIYGESSNCTSQKVQDFC